MFGERLGSVHVAYTVDAHGNRTNRIDATNSGAGSANAALLNIALSIASP